MVQSHSESTETVDALNDSEEDARRPLGCVDAGTHPEAMIVMRKNYLAVQHAQLPKRRGMDRAQVAVAHSILVAAYWMLKRDEPYHDLGADWHSQGNDEAHTRRLIAQLEHLGPHGDHRPSRLNIGSC